VYASALMPWTLDGVRELVSAYRGSGYGAVKLGWGPIGQDARQDVELVRAAREACGPDLELMIDAGRVWTWKQALQMSRRFEEFELSWLEEPLPVDDIDGYARLCEQSALRIASAENETTIFAFREWIERAGLDIVQPDLARCGGFTQARRIAALSYERNVAMVPHAFSTGILVAASLHMTAAMPHGTLTEFSVADGALVRDLLLDPFRLESDGTVLVPTGPGLGIELDPSVVERFRVG
jgi:L-rhamnonate dehydratase